MKKNVLALAAIVLAIGFSAFTNVKSARTTFYYGLNSAGDTYNKITTGTPSEEDCTQTLNPACLISYSSDQGSSFPANNIPSGGTQSSTKGYYNP